MKQPKPLQPGDRVAIIATANAVNKTELDAGIQLLKDWKLEPVIGSSIGLKKHQRAGDDDERIADLQQQLDDPTIKAIWCARGGYGTVRLIDHLYLSKFYDHPKWIIGYSDITALHAKLNDLNFATLHALMPVQIKKMTAEAIESLRQILFGKSECYNWASHRLNRAGEGRGQLVGGNLSVLYSLCGSPSVPDMDRRILFIEDLDEHLYHVDRMLQNLKRNGWFEQLEGLVIGGMTAMRDHTKAFGFAEDNPYGKTAHEIIAEAVEDYNFPVAFGFPAGHVPDNRALILGQKVKLQVTEDGSAMTAY